MDNLSINKKILLEKFNLPVDVTKSKDILGKDDIKIKDIFGNPSKINKMSDIFPKSEKSDENGFFG